MTLWLVVVDGKPYGLFQTQKKVLASFPGTWINGKDKKRMRRTEPTLQKVEAFELEVMR